jgi:hypothetical protein
VICSRHLNAAQWNQLQQRAVACPFNLNALLVSSAEDLAAAWRRATAQFELVPSDPIDAP